MATKIRLKRFGGKHDPHFRIVVADGPSRRDGRTIEELGYYNPTKDPIMLKVNRERAIYWMGVGGQPSETVRSLFRREGILAEMAGHPIPEKAASEEAPADEGAADEPAADEAPEDETSADEASADEVEFEASTE